MIGDWLYQLTRKDAISQPVLQRAVMGQGASGAAVNVDCLLQAVPPDRIFHCTQIFGIGLAGAAQTTLRLDWVIMVDGATAFASLSGWTANPALQNYGQGQTVDFIMMPGEQLRCRGVFSAAGAVNTVSAGAVGMFLPKGNLQLR